jgi:1,5-anhydro-D-fructose reductase (1,5-anhydro-D-mannitol-forming)
MRGGGVSIIQPATGEVSTQVPKLVGCGIIGFGKMGQIRAKAIAESGAGTVLAAYDPNPIAPSSDITPVDTDMSVIEHPDVEAVFICTPNFRNKPLTIAALRAGKNVFCEKPPAMTVADVKEIMQVEQETGCTLMYGFNHRHHESIKHAKHVIDSGEFGRVLWMRGRYGKSVDESFFNGWRAKRELAGGGILLDQGIHMLDLLLYFSGGFDEVKAMVSNLFWKLDGIEDNVFANFRSSKTGIVASLHSTMTQWRHLFSLEIFLSKGHIVINGLKTSSNSYGDEMLTMERNNLSTGGVDWTAPETKTYHIDTSWASEVDHFFKCIHDDTPVLEGCSSDALAVMQLIEEVYAAG